MSFKVLRAYGVHFYTAAGIILAFLAGQEILAEAPNVPRVFVYLFLAVFIDATDGTLARKFEVKKHAPAIDGATLDNIVDYINYTFLPLLLVWKMNWLPESVNFLIWLAMMASLFGFANVHAKDEKAGYFLGFPSYWNYFAFYAGLWTIPEGIWVNAALVLLFIVLSVLPLKFIYPNLAPQGWRVVVMIGAVSWQLMLAVMLLRYESLPAWLILVSLSYPVFYTGLSLSLQKSFR